MKYSYGFRNTTILYGTAREFGAKVYEAGVLTELGGNPYDPDSTDYDDFNTGYRHAREQDFEVVVSSFELLNTKH